jgi:heme/copper-type cytochrome/quinol oxidase subunit 3
VAQAAIDKAHGPGAGRGGGGHETSTGLPNTKLGMWLFLASECLLFGALITTYVLYRGTSTVGPYPHEIFDIHSTSVSSFVLLASSVTMVLALTAAQKRDTGRMRLWLLTTALLGMTFVGGQVYEFTTFYVLTGFHGVHVTVGIMMLLSLVGMSWTDRLPDDPAFPVEMVGLYWHFVDVVWIVIFTVVYLIPTGPKGP